MAGPEELKKNKQFGGWNIRYKHHSESLGCDMTFTVYYPPQSSGGQQTVPIIYYLSGLTCNDENFISKAGAQRKAAEMGVALIAPDTSPRGLGVEGEDDEGDLGTGAGFYLNATQPKWKGYRMYDYILHDLPDCLSKLSGLNLKKASIMGHSMGGHGALVIGLRNSERFHSISAFAPISHPSVAPWGKKCFTAYLGSDQSQWKQYDATELLGSYSGPKLQALIDVGTDDPFLKEQLRVDDLEAAAQGKLQMTLRLQDGYDHSYFTIATFVDDHIAMHAAALGK